jgi:uncharacterized integral membrane protein (TIGR00698 family)
MDFASAGASAPSRDAAGRWMVPVAAVACLLPQVPAAAALLIGITVAVTVGNPWLAHTKRFTPRLLAASVVGLGAGMNLFQMKNAGTAGIGYTVVSIVLTFAIGTLLGRWVRTRSTTSLLITAGTAICGGSAIAALAPAVHAPDEDVSVSLGTVFILNAVALVVFPWIGHRLGLTQSQFGIWSALAIHDTSSVVGATLQYGREALQVGTTVKLTRALWIVPVTLIVGYLRTKQTQGGHSARGRTKRPWFILGFVLMAALMTWLPVLRPTGHEIEAVSKRLLVVTLFLIGTNLTAGTIRRVGVRPFAQGVLLWAIVATATLGAIELGWIHELAR